MRGAGYRTASGAAFALVLLSVGGCTSAGDSHDPRPPTARCEEAACGACAVAGFDRAAPELQGADRVRALVGTIEPTWCPGYAEARTYLIGELDREPSGEVECVYTGRRVVPPAPGALTVEHTWPRSRGSADIPAVCDLHHLYPSAPQANRTRSNHPFGEVTGDVFWAEGGSRLGANADGRTVFEPRDAHKGNVARSMLYFAARYGLPLGEAEQALYARWHALDPVDDAEVRRTFAIAGRQLVPNPFVVCPELVDAL